MSLLANQWSVVWIPAPKNTAAPKTISAKSL